MKPNKYKIKSGVWLYPGETANWHFTTIPKKESDKINKKFWDKRRGWSSFPVSVTLGKTNWRTSIFFDKKSGTYLLPLKSQVRKKEGIMAQDKVSFTIEIKV